MRRFVALAIIASLLSVSSIPLLPGASHCAHAAEAVTDEDCTSCHTGKMVEQAVPAPSKGHEKCPEMASAQPEMHHSDHAMHMDHTMAQAAEADHKHHQLTEAERECRIECGCGCNRVTKGFPLLLSPHVASSVDFDSSISVSTAPAIFQLQPEERALRIPVPPPQIS